MIERYLRAFHTPTIARTNEDDLVLALGGTLLLVAGVAAVLLVDLVVRLRRRWGRR